MCANAGKHLCTNEEWQIAVTGTPDPGDGVTIPYGGAALDACNVKSNAGRGSDASGVGTPANTHAHVDCVSRFGAYDMVGNLTEFVADWHQAGAPLVEPELWGRGRPIVTVACGIWERRDLERQRPCVQYSELGERSSRRCAPRRRLERRNAQRSICVQSERHAFALRFVDGRAVLLGRTVGLRARDRGRVTSVSVTFSCLDDGVRAMDLDRGQHSADDTPGPTTPSTF